MRNIYLSQKDSAPRSAPARPSPAGAGRAALENDVLEELTAWSPRERHGVFRSWHRHALSLVHLNVLAVLESEGPLSMKSLAEAMDVSDASVTGIVDRMEKRGLVERRHATDDRRQVVVYLADAGAQVFRDMESQRREIHQRVVSELSEDELAAVLKGMRAIHAARARVVAEIHCGEVPTPTEEVK
jgi:MarR family 2-MHQ and catechol resistance regulon transcriptional repressor